MEDIALPVALYDFLYKDADRKEQGLQEPISSYYFKHGTSGLADVHLIGIKEQTAPSFVLPETAFIGVAQQIAQALSAMLFPADAYRVTPLALFRKLL